MNKKVLGTLVLGLSCAAVLAPMTSQAEDVPPLNSKASTDVGIKFATDDNTTEEDGPFDDTVAINARPTKFNFGEVTATNNRVNTYNQVLSSETPQYLSVIDDHKDGTTQPWKLQAKLSELKNTNSESTKTKAEATLTFSANELVSFKLPEKTDGQMPLRIPVPSDAAEYKGTDVVGQSSVSLKAGADAEQLVMNGKKDTPKGGYAANISKVKLVVAAQDKLAGEEFTGNVTWSLTDSI